MRLLGICSELRPTCIGHWQNKHKFIAKKDDDEIEADTLKELQQKIRRYEKKKIDGIYNESKVIVHFVEGEGQLWITYKDGGSRERCYASNIYIDNESNNKTLNEIKKLNDEEKKLREEKNDFEEEKDKEMAKMEENIDKKRFNERTEKLRKTMLPVNYKEKVVDSL